MLTYLGLFEYFKVAENLISGIVFLIIFLMYYLFDIANFNSYKVNSKKIILSIIINGLGFIFMLLLNKDKKTIFVFVLYTVIQILSKYLLSFLSRKTSRVLILGYDTPTEKIINILNENKDKYNYIGYVHENIEILNNYLGKVEDIESIVKEKGIDEIIFTSRKQVKKYADIVMNLKLKGVKVIDYLSFLEEEEGKVDVDKIDSLWVLMGGGFVSFNDTMQRRIKRAFDLILAVVIGICALPIMIVAAIIVKLESPGPIIYSQARIGENQKEFFVHKFRSMRNDAEKNGAKWAVENDPRVTKFGNFMRKTRIDELPQIWNVFKGEMSFIGPRPERQVFITEIEKVVPYYNVRHVIKPGLTGWAQVMYPYGASIEDAKKKLEYDLYYIKHQDILLDIIIFFKTIQIVVFGKGR
ncbi:MAG: TIGR03013 family PEP-CTERM/XrtA system glycosyltransferase [Fusobacterium perfoetens]|uniref:TIGR03013 family XrtA/PEP-CTERM system glycosyltransferase n=1 Tax=Fusobacterium perfoetens TaxID=852 RepID=UPI0023F48D4C|nr:TIGR03013 family XrtA/PEP-CTERM system glycosyltransferase [Fusobacterium perfoetens]MCI6152856.1 TIGR03013 family PEP-CTERM/XrtA system glycosyltransferase [Fusobacterium perfoetens]MDY3237266.1 TIGR03013 family XrtA/PEP-CTERM system glycosyltransferase [Fusobacterium perfoetens]